MPDSEKLIPEISIVESLFTLNKLRGPKSRIKEAHPLTVSGKKKSQFLFDNFPQPLLLPHLLLMMTLLGKKDSHY